MCFESRLRTVAYIYYPVLILQPSVLAPAGAGLLACQSPQEQETTMLIIIKKSQWKQALHPFFGLFNSRKKSIFWSYFACLFDLVCF